MFGEIRTLTSERGETFFVGKAIAEALGYRNTRDALFRHVDDEDKTTVAIRDTGSNYNEKDGQMCQNSDSPVDEFRVMGCSSKFQFHSFI